ncbi:TOBE domain-containing protein [Gulbenkiania mobilis]|uniref:Molybdate transport system regulatory protein n=1 Tax=Gulbenkiania mobilis TaxID=397457 RepID=A0ABY2CTY4_GULMO|nr:molybdate transport system regulatory protein [Gulbenkiania mobilis]
MADISSRLAADLPFGPGLSPARLALLEAVARTGSISAAARAVGLSYKGAWQAVEAMNNLSDTPLVARSAGGREGGGTRLTERGATLLRTWQAVAQAQARFLLAVEGVIRTTDDLALLQRLTMKTSARNQWYGRVHTLRPGAVNDMVEVELPGGDRLTALITRESCELLGLCPGSEVVALVKAGSVLLATGDTDHLAVPNRLTGTISRLTAGAVNCDVVIDLPSGQCVAATVDRSSAEALGLVPGLCATALFSANQIILGALPRLHTEPPRP